MNMTQLKSTKHSKQRLKERMNLSTKKEINTLLTQVPLYGKNPEEFTGEFKEFLITKRRRVTKNVHIKVYVNHIYIYKGHSLLTSYPVPKRFLPVEQYLPASKELKSKLKGLQHEIDTNEFDIRIINTGDTQVAALYIENIFECFGQGNNIEEAKSNVIDTYYKLHNIDK